jgi:hypothetical protein
MTSGVSEEVAMAVTQPLWPFKDPRKRRDSDMAVSVLEANFRDWAFAQIPTV